MALRYTDRREAGQKLAEKLTAYKGRKDTLVLALPRGGVAVGSEVAKALDLPLDLILVRKLGVPGDEEFAMGAIAMGGVRFLNEQTLRLTQISPSMVEQVIVREEDELKRRNEIYRKGKPPPDIRGQTVILVDDGMATGSDMLVAVQAARQLGASRVVVAAPVSSDTAHELLEHDADETVCLYTPSLFMGVGGFYQSFDQLTDDDVLRLLEESRV